MRSVFIKKLHEAMRRDSRIFFLMGDTGFNLVEPLFEEFPDRTLNVGVAEQNMIGISAGLANAGFRPICYAISNFLVQRCFEQIRNDICLHNYPIILAGTSAGFDNGTLWATHYIVEDIGCLKTLPNIQIYSPSTMESIETICEEIFKFEKPAYVRIAKSNFSTNRRNESLEEFIFENPASDILVMTHGKMLKNAYEAASASQKFSVFAVNKIKPLHAEKLNSLFQKFKKIVVVEDNFKSGLYNSICQFLAENKLKNDVYFIGPNEEYEKHIGDPKHLEEKYGLTPDKINQFINQVV